LLLLGHLLGAMTYSEGVEEVVVANVEQPQGQAVVVTGQPCRCGIYISTPDDPATGRGPYLYLAGCILGSCIADIRQGLPLTCETQTYHIIALYLTSALTNKRRLVHLLVEIAPTRQGPILRKPWNQDSSHWSPAGGPSIAYSSPIQDACKARNKPTGGCH
jgi:hypothetical protein